MNKYIRILAFLLISYSIAAACRYTVREIGFARFGNDTYQLILFDDSRISSEDAELFRNITHAALYDANIKATVIEVEKEPNSPFMAFYKYTANGMLPNLVLIAPEGRHKILSFHRNDDFTQILWHLLEQILSSPAREILNNKIVESFGVICLVEGSDAEENNRIRNILKTSVNNLESIMMNLPKPVENPPEIISIRMNETAREDIFLWALGWEEENKNQPAVALLYGRGRRMGPLLKGENIREDIITNMLQFIGEDCECGLDRSWILGTMIPLRWDSQNQKTVLGKYGFDAENPLVISEMRKILSMTPDRIRQFGDSRALYGYSESILRRSDTGRRRNSDPASLNSEETPSGIKKSFGITLIGVICVIMIGGFIIIRKRSKTF